MKSLNESAFAVCQHIEADAHRLRARVHRDASGATIIDLGVEAEGGLQAGLLLASACMAGLGNVALAACDAALWRGPAVTVATDHPLHACMAAQYAGWQIAHEKYFAMGSGPMRAAARKEELFADLRLGEHANVAVGCLETSKLPPSAVCEQVAFACGVAPARLTLLAARTGSLAGTLQVVARSIETAMHKLHELKFDLSRVVSGWGTAPLPPGTQDDITAIGRTNDAVLYGGEVTLWMRGDDDSLAEVGPRVPSSASADYGEPFGDIFKRYGGDFYQIDPLLFSPAVVTLVNVESGRVHRFGRTAPQIIERSFAGS